MTSSWFIIIIITAHWPHYTDARENEIHLSNDTDTLYFYAM